jgi:hypothetical protein
LLRDRLFGRKSEQTVEPNKPQLALFNEPESEQMPVIGDADEEVVAPVPRRGERKPLSADLSRIEVIHELPERRGGATRPSTWRWAYCRTVHEIFWASGLNDRGRQVLDEGLQ